MGVTALYCAGRLAVAPFRRRGTDRAADLLHVVMGTVMTAALLGVLDRRLDLVWVVGFLAAALWFGRAAVAGRRVPARHALQHGAGCLAMVVMLVAGTASYALGPVAPRPGSATGMPGMSGGRGGGGGGGMGGGMGGSAGMAAGAGTVGLLLLAALAAGLIVLSLAEVRQVVAVGTAPSPRQLTAAAPSRPMLAPRCAAGCRVAMGVAMAVALLSML